MRNSIVYIGLAFLSLAATGCRKEKDLTIYSDRLIRFSGGEVTKGFLEENGLNNTGTQVKVYDFLTGFEGEVNGTAYTAIDRIKYIDDVVEYSASTASWPYAIDAHEYRWTKSGVHRFFGWLYKDQAYSENGLTTNAFFGSDPSLEGLVMTTPDYCWTSASPQYDFVYSKAPVIRDAALKDYSNVVLPMKHLFTAISLTFENKSTSTKVKVTGLGTLLGGEDLFLHKGFASVDFSGEGEVTPTYTLTGDADHPFFSAENIRNKVIEPGDRYDLLSGEKGTETYYMTWPLTADQISPGPSGTDIFGEQYYTDADKILSLTYQEVVSGYSETVRIAFPKKAWQAGTRNHMNIEFTDKAISIAAETLPWDYNVQEMSFNSESLVVPDGGKLAIDGATGLADNATIHITPDKPEVTCKLSISSLKGCTLVITKVGADPSFFTLEPNTLNITGNQLSFKVKASDLPTGGVARTCRLSFSVELPDGREIDGDSEILGDDHNYTFSRQ